MWTIFGSEYGVIVGSATIISRSFLDIMRWSVRYVIVCEITCQVGIFARRDEHACCIQVVNTCNARITHTTSHIVSKAHWECFTGFPAVLVCHVTTFPFILSEVWQIGAMAVAFALRYTGLGR